MDDRLYNNKRDQNDITRPFSRFSTPDRQLAVQKSTPFEFTDQMEPLIVSTNMSTNYLAQSLGGHQPTPVNMVELDVTKTLPTSLRRNHGSESVSPLSSPSCPKSRTNLPAWQPPCLPRPHSPTPKQTLRPFRKHYRDQQVNFKPQTSEISTETGASIQLSSGYRSIKARCGMCNKKHQQCSPPVFGHWNEYQKDIWVQNAVADAARYGSSPCRSCGPLYDWVPPKLDHPPSQTSYHCIHAHYAPNDSGKSSRTESPTVGSRHHEHHKCRRLH